MQKGFRSGEHRACAICGSAFYVPPYRVKRGNAFYCSPTCAAVGKMAKRTPPIKERFWSKVDRRGPHDCWPWLGALLRHGYGQVRFRDRNWVSSRVAYVLAYG